MRTRTRVMSAIGGLFAAALMAIAPSSAAFAGGSDSPTPYTVTASGITLPLGSVFVDNQEINLHTTVGDKSIHFEAKCVAPQVGVDDRPECFTGTISLHDIASNIGQNFIPWSIFGLTGEFCVTWVQIGGFNEHFGEGGQQSVCIGVDECVVNPAFAYGFDPATGSGPITASGGKEGQLLCDPLYVRAITYGYDLPAFGSPSWTQHLFGYNDLLVDRIGTFRFAAPQLETCRQYDMSASFEGWDALAVPSKLLGPNNPFEPPFLHDTLKGMGPYPTWSYTSSLGCNTTVVAVPDFGQVPETCSVDGSATLGNTETAAWVRPGVFGPGIYTEIAHPIGDAKFAPGEGVSEDGKTYTKTFTVLGKTGYQSTNPDGACYVAPVVAVPDFGQVPETCKDDGSATLGNTETAAWLHPGVFGPGIYTEIAHPIGDAKFVPGEGVSEDRLTFTKSFTVLGKTGYQSTNHEGACYKAPVVVDPPKSPDSPGTCTADGILPKVPTNDAWIAAYDRKYVMPGVYTLTYTLKDEYATFESNGLRSISRPVTVGGRIVSPLCPLLAFTGTDYDETVLTIQVAGGAVGLGAVALFASWLLRRPRNKATLNYGPPPIA